MADIDIQNLPAPDIVEDIDYESILSQRKSDLLALVPEALRPSVDTTLAYESEPLTMLLQESAYREMILRQRINEASRAVMLAYARGSDLDQLAVFFGVERLVVREADPDTNPPEPRVMESDADFLSRIRLSLRGLSVAGPADAYAYWALSASGNVLDARATSPQFEFIEWIDSTDIRMRVVDDAGLSQPMPGDVAVSVLARLAYGTVDQPLLDLVQDSIAADDVRPLTDNPRARAADVVDYQIDATLYFYDGPDSSVVKQAATDAAQQYADDSHRLGRDVARSGIFAALHQPGVQHVDLRSPASDIDITPRQAPYCTDLTVLDGGINE